MVAGQGELSGRVAIVTGAGRNIGRATAMTLAEGGAAVVVNARSNQAEADAVVKEIEAKGGKATFDSLTGQAEISFEKIDLAIDPAIAICQHGS